MYRRPLQRQRVQRRSRRHVLGPSVLSRVGVWCVTGHAVAECWVRQQSDATAERADRPVPYPKQLDAANSGCLHAAWGLPRCRPLSCACAVHTTASASQHLGCHCTASLTLSTIVWSEAAAATPGQRMLAHACAYRADVMQCYYGKNKRCLRSQPRRNGTILAMRRR